MTKLSGIPNWNSDPAFQVQCMSKEPGKYAKAVHPPWKTEDELNAEALEQAKRLSSEPATEPKKP